MPKAIIDPRIARIRKLYQALDAMPQRRKDYLALHKEELKRMRAEIEKAWEAIEGIGNEQQPIDFPVHHGGTFVGRARQPKTGTHE